MFKQLEEAVTTFQENNNQELNKISKSIYDMKIEFNEGLKSMKEGQAEMMMKH